MSEENPQKQDAPAEAKPEPAKNSKCPQSPTRDHDMFHNEGTDETYCRYCGKT